MPTPYKRKSAAMIAAIEPIFLGFFQDLMNKKQV
jgi:hypothetical protein